MDFQNKNKNKIKNTDKNESPIEPEALHLNLHSKTPEVLPAHVSSKSPKVIIFLTVFIYLVGFGMIIPIIPILGQNFGATSLQVGLLMSIYSLMQFLFAPFWGRLSDRYGRRPIILFCLVGEGLAYLFFAQARSLEMLFVARFLAGFFSGSISTASAYISDITPPQQRSKGMALIGVAFGLGFIFGPAIGGALTLWAKTISQAPNFETSFAAWWVSGFCFANFLFALRFLKESRPAEIRSQQIVTKSSRFQTMSKYFAIETLGNLLFAFLISSLAFSMMESTLILYMGAQYHWTLKEVSFGFAFIGVVATLTQGLLVRKAIPKYGEKIVLFSGLILLGLGFVGISLSTSLVTMAFAMTFLAVGNGLANPASLGSISLLVNSAEQGAALGVAQSMASLGRILGPALGGLVYGYYNKMPYILSATLVALAILILRLKFSKLPETGKIAKATT